ncbi:unnamed protein product [Malus baccata var. baccata]
MGDNDPWLAPDKLQHVLFCFSLTLIFSTLATRTRHPFLRRHSIWFGSILSLLAGAAKEFADELGFFRSAGASAKDAVADFVGVLIGSLVLYFVKYVTRPENETGRLKEVWQKLAKDDGIELFIAGNRSSNSLTFDWTKAVS